MLASSGQDQRAFTCGRVEELKPFENGGVGVDGGFLEKFQDPFGTESFPFRPFQLLGKLPGALEFHFHGFARGRRLHQPGDYFVTRP